MKEKNVKKEKKIDVDGFVNEFFYLDNIYSEAIETLKLNQLKAMKKNVKKFNINLLTDINLGEIKKDILDDHMFKKSTDISEFDAVHRIIDDFCFTYVCDSADVAKELFPDVFNLKQSQ